MWGIFPPLWIEALAALIVLAVLSYIQFRHVILAVLVALVPLPCVAVALAFRISPDPVSYLFGVLSGAVLTSGIAARICADKTARSAVRETILSVWPLLIWPSVVATALYGLAAVIAGKLVVLATAGISVASVVSAVSFVFVGGSILPYSEDFITRANRLRETRERRLDTLAFITQPRWGWSIGGIGLVFSVLGYFSGSAPFWTGTTWLTFGAAEAFLALTALLATRSLNTTAAFAFTGAVLICMASWVALPPALVPVLALVIAPTLVTAMQTAGFAREGDKTATAILRSLERHAVTIIFFSFESAVVLWLFGQSSAAILAVSGAPAALLLFPAFFTATCELLPARVSLDAYRMR